MNYAEFQREVYAVAFSKGWHDEPLRERCPPDYERWHVHTDRVLAKLALVHSELSEAWDEAREGRLKVWYSTDRPGKPEGFVVEIADACIRVLDLCAALGLVVESVSAVGCSGTLDELHAQVSSAVEDARTGDYAVNFVDACSLFVSNCERMCRLRDLDLPDAMRRKIDYNKTRPHRHGGKLA